MNAPVLELRDVSLAIGGVHILTDISIAIEQGSCLGIIGPNGAGKTTLFNIASGFMKPTAGEVRLDDQPITGVAPHKVTRRGLVRTFQNVGGFGELTVRENLELATRGRDADAVEKVSELLGLRDDWNVLVKDCSLASRKLVGIGVAVVRRPRVLLLDEPLAGLATDDRDHVVQMIKRVHADGTTLALIEHDIARTRALVDRLVVLDAGEKVADGSPQELAQRSDVMEAYLS